MVIVATVRALKYHGGVKLENLSRSDVAAVRKGFVNLARHIDNVAQFGVPAVRMPGLPAKPAALSMDIDAEGNITGLI